MARTQYRGLKVCCGITTILLITIAVVLVTLYFTMFKPKDPVIIPKPVTIEALRWSLFPIPLLNATINVPVTIDNKNYGSFKYDESMAYISYRGNVIAEAPIEADKIPARAKHDVSVSVTIFGDKLLEDENFAREFGNGELLNFTSSSTLHGKVTVLKLFKAKATSFSTCDISLSVPEQHVETVCKSRVIL